MGNTRCPKYNHSPPNLAFPKDFSGTHSPTHAYIPYTFSESSHPANCTLRQLSNFQNSFRSLFFGLMHFRLARNKGATYVTLLWIASQKWIVADINEYHSLSLSSFSETKMRANVTHKHHPTLSGNEKRCLCIPKVRNKSSCACRIISQMRKRLIMPPLIVRPHPREAKSWENVS